MMLKERKNLLEIRKIFLEKCLLERKLFRYLNKQKQKNIMKTLNQIAEEIRKIEVENNRRFVSELSASILSLMFGIYIAYGISFLL